MKTISFIGRLSMLICLSCISLNIFAQDYFQCLSRKKLSQIKTDTNWVSQMNYDRKAQIFYQISNDDKYLEIYLKIPDEIVQKKIIAFGFTVWIDTTGKRKKNISVRFPYIDKPQRGPKQGKTDIFNIKKYEIIKSFQDIELTGFNGRKSKSLININNSEDINVEIYFDNKGFLIYELLLPLNRVSPSFNTVSAPVFSLGFETGCLEALNPPAGQGRRPPGAPPPNSNMYEIEQLKIPSKFWIKKINIFQSND